MESHVWQKERRSCVGLQRPSVRSCESVVSQSFQAKDHIFGFKQSKAEQSKQATSTGTKRTIKNRVLPSTSTCRTKNTKFGRIRTSLRLAHGLRPPLGTDVILSAAFEHPWQAGCGSETDPSWSNLRTVLMVSCGPGHGGKHHLP